MTEINSISSLDHIWSQDLDQSKAHMTVQSLQDLCFSQIDDYLSCVNIQDYDSAHRVADFILQLPIKLLRLIEEKQWKSLDLSYGNQFSRFSLVKILIHCGMLLVS